MKRAFGVCAAALVAVAIIAACSKDYDSANNAGPDAASADATFADAVADATSTPLPGDAGPDARPTFCDTFTSDASVVFCADFDDPAKDAGYTQTLADAGTLAIVTDVWTSPPASLLADSLARATPNNRGGAIAWSSKGATLVKAVHLHANVRPAGELQGPSTGGSGEATFIDVSLSNETFAELVWSDSGGYSIEAINDGNAATGAAKPLTRSPVFGIWTALEFDVLLGTAPTESTVTMSLDGVVVATIAGAPISAASDVTISIGNTSLGPLTSPTGLYYDDVRIEITRE